MGSMRDRLITVFVGLAIVATTDACTSPSQSHDSAAPSAQVDSLFLHEIRPGAPGCAVGVYRSGEIVLARGYGVASVEDGRPITSRTTFNLGSASKPFTALAALMLEQRGALSMADDVRRWVPELPDYGTPIRVRDLLQHTSGLRDFGTLELLSGRVVSTQAEFLGLVASQRALNFAPGTRHEYSHTDFGVLGVIVQRIVGVPFGEHLQNVMFGPLGMSGSFVDDLGRSALRDRALGHQVLPRGPSVAFPNSHTFGGDNVYASVEDLARWDRNFDQPIVGGAEIMARMLSRPTLPNGDTIPYAYGVRLDTYRGLRTVSRRGHPPGTQTVFMRFPEQRFTVATLCNADDLSAPKLAERVADIYLADVMSLQKPRVTPPKAVAMSPPELTRYAGTYRSIDDPWNVLSTEVRQGVLGEIIPDDAADEVFYPMTPAGDGRFFEIGGTGNVGLYTFRPSASGGPLRLEISWNEGPIELSERVTDAAVWRPSAAALAEYAGTWFSPDLDAGWQLETRGARLVLRRRDRVELTLQPVERDRFLRGFGSDGDVSVRLQFRRDRTGRVSELTVSTLPGENAVRNVQFTRLVAH
ncbi:serine hydrolase domain-containing protein [Gemmatimonas groenlandica]|uniref:Beta-lactamase family protein n=1 Tax=Gemmatimonas groenlandica TaxID=2732249 RepID=A0A6M4IV32_9BACT|nr:serine hydrolase domain-containing protein [Gemmatimonas groenlandica]QJR37619.1 beta-lactamase family protein [Gemmatimonas groenlandica]